MAAGTTHERSPMTDAKTVAPERDDDEDLAVDLDLDADDALLREAIGAPTTIRLNGKVLTVPHMKDWEHNATQFMSQGLFAAWARRVMSDDDFKAFQDAELKNYQVERIVEICQRNSGTTAGKRSRPSPSSRSTRKR
jgi:hypothetical protein